RRVGAPQLCRWDATRLPLASASVDRIISNPPFGKQLSSPGQIGPLYRRMVAEDDRVLKPGGAAVLLVSGQEALREPAAAGGGKGAKGQGVRVLGQRARISVWRKADESDTMPG